LIALGVVIYLPFIKTMDKQYLIDEAKAESSTEVDNISLDDLTF